MRCHPYHRARGFLADVTNEGFITVTPASQPTTSTLLLESTRQGKRTLIAELDPSCCSNAVGLDGRVLLLREDGVGVVYPGAQDSQLQMVRGSFDAKSRITTFGTGDELYVLEEPRNTSRVLPYRPVPGAKTKLEPAITERVWVNSSWILRSSTIGYVWFWDISKRDGSATKILAYGEVGACGQPLMGDSVLGVDRETQEVVVFPIMTGNGVTRLPGPSLTTPYCVAGENGTIAVTGLKDGLSAVGVYRDGTWQVLKFPGRPSIFEPQVVDGMVIVSAPEADMTDRRGRVTARGAGAVYVLEQESGAWKVRTRIVAEKPRNNGLLGYNVHVDSGKLFINYLKDSPHVSEEYFGEPAICEAQLPKARGR